MTHPDDIEMMRGVVIPPDYADLARQLREMDDGLEWSDLLQSAAKAIKRLQAERDEWREMYKANLANGHEDARQIDRLQADLAAANADAAYEAGESNMNADYFNALDELLPGVEIWPSTVADAVRALQAELRARIRADQ